MASSIDMMRRGKVLWWLLGVNAAVFVVVTAVSYAVPGAVLWFALPGDLSVWLTRPWTLLSYMVTQADPLHLLFNMLTLLWFGSILQTRYSQTRLLALYVGGGLCGALLFMLLSGLWNHVGVQWLMGASASVLAMMTAAGCLMGDYRLHLFFIGDVRLRWIVVAMLVLSFLSLGGGSAGGGMAHVGGVIFGLVWSLAERRGMIFGRDKSSGKEQRRRMPTEAGARRVASILEQNRRDKIRLDELLDKINVSGYDSLSSSERKELDEISRRISK